MAKDETRRLKPSTIDDDKRAFSALQAMSTYRPINPDYAVDKITIQLNEMETARTIEAQAAAALNAIRDRMIAAEWAFHNAILGVKQQVIAQFGQDANEIQALGLKKKSERKSPTRQKLPKT
jgi:hypothetical protein